MSSGSETLSSVEERIYLEEVEENDDDCYETESELEGKEELSSSPPLSPPSASTKNTSSISPIIPFSSAKSENTDSAFIKRDEIIRDHSTPLLSPEDVKDEFWDSIYNPRPFNSSRTYEYHRRSSSLPSVASSASSYFSYRQNDAPLRWRNRLTSASKNQLVGQLLSTPTAGQGNIKYSYKEAMNVICRGEGQHPFNHCSRPEDEDEDFDSTPNTSLTTLTRTSESIDPPILGSNEFLELPESRMISLLQKDDLEVPEIEIWNNLITWGIKNTPKVQFDPDVSKWSSKDFEVLARTLRNCIYWIRFHQIEPRDFAKYVLPYRQIVPPFIIGNFLRQQITGHLQLSPLLAPPRIASSLLDSSIITGRHATILESWIKEEEPLDGNLSYKFNLLYRGSRDGISPKIFQQKCNGQGPTVLIVKNFGSDQIVGGYNPTSYRSTRKFANWLRRNSRDKKKENLKKMNAFIFSFQARYYPEETAMISRILPQHVKEATMKHHSGPCFGAGPDLWIKLDVNDKKTQLYPASYEHSILDHGNVEWEDFEIFKVVKAS